VLQQYPDVVARHVHEKDALDERRAEADRYQALAPRLNARDIRRIVLGRRISDVQWTRGPKPHQVLLRLDNGRAVCIQAYAMSRNAFAAFLTFYVSAIDTSPFEPREPSGAEVKELMEGTHVRGVSARGSPRSHETTRLTINSDVRTITIEARTLDTYDWAYLRFMEIVPPGKPLPGWEQSDHFAPTGELLNDSGERIAPHDPDFRVTTDQAKEEVAPSEQEVPDAVRQLRQEAHLDALLGAGRRSRHATVSVFLDVLDEHLAEARPGQARSETAFAVSVKRPRT
jgi:hypothetical protein